METKSEGKNNLSGLRIEQVSGSVDNVADGKVKGRNHSILILSANVQQVLRYISTGKAPPSLAPLSFSLFHTHSPPFMTFLSPPCCFAA